MLPHFILGMALENQSHEVDQLRVGNHPADRVKEHTLADRRKVSLDVAAQGPRMGLCQ
jgi:hypothetical protein